MSKNNNDFFRIKNSWSEIKDRLLGSYLTPYFQKVLRTNQPIFYVDCFAGKGRFEDGKPGSPIIALEARNASLAKTTIEEKAQKIKSCFIELNHAEELKKNISPLCSSSNTIEVISGRFEDHIEKLLINKTNINIFLYIDPYGIRALNSKFFDKLSTLKFRSIELLINFNSFGFFRNACQALQTPYNPDLTIEDINDLVEYDPTEITASPQSIELLNTIAGGEFWRDIVDEYRQNKIGGYEAEQKLSQAYKNRLQQKYKYVLDMPIRLKASHRPKYRLIHVSNHQDGCLLMANNMLKRKDELFLNVQQGGQRTLFDTVDTITSTVENDIISEDNIKTMLVEHLTKIPNEIRLKELLVDFFNKHGLLCPENMIRSALENLKEEKYLEIIRDPAHTKQGLPTAFWEEKGKQSIAIRRTQA